MTKRKAARLWRITLEDGDTFTIEAGDKGEAIDKSVKYRGRKTRIHKVENVAVLMVANKI